MKKSDKREEAPRQEPMEVTTTTPDELYNLDDIVREFGGWSKSETPEDAAEVPVIPAPPQLEEDVKIFRKTSEKPPVPPAKEKRPSRFQVIPVELGTAAAKAPDPVEDVRPEKAPKQ